MNFLGIFQFLTRTWWDFSFLISSLYLLICGSYLIFVYSLMVLYVCYRWCQIFDRPFSIYGITQKPTKIPRVSLIALLPFFFLLFSLVVPVEWQLSLVLLITINRSRSRRITLFSAGVKCGRIGSVASRSREFPKRSVVLQRDEGGRALTSINDIEVCRSTRRVHSTPNATVKLNYFVRWSDIADDSILFPFSFLIIIRRRTRRI